MACLRNNKDAHHVYSVCCVRGCVKGRWFAWSSPGQCAGPIQNEWMNSIPEADDNYLFGIFYYRISGFLPFPPFTYPSAHNNYQKNINGTWKLLTWIQIWNKCEWNTQNVHEQIGNSQIGDELICKCSHLWRFANDNKNGNVTDDSNHTDHTIGNAARKINDIDDVGHCVSQNEKRRCSHIWIEPFWLRI